MVEPAGRRLECEQPPQHALFAVGRLGRQGHPGPEVRAPVLVDPLEPGRETVFRHECQPRRKQRRIQRASATVAPQAGWHLDHAESREGIRQSAVPGLGKHLLDTPDDAVLVFHHLAEAVELARVLGYDEDFELDAGDFDGAALEP